jgi:hypothetical protein
VGIKIVKLDYNVVSESLDIFCSGCIPPYCVDCFNPELKDFNVGTPYNLKHSNYIDNTILNFDKMIKRVLLVGGSWTHQRNYESALLDIHRICKKYDKPLFLFARENLDDIPEMFKIYCDYIKCNPYNPELKVDNYESHGIKLATANQVIYKKGIDY